MDYIKNAWLGKVNPKKFSRFMLLIQAVLLFIGVAIPALNKPLVIFEIPFLTWLFVAFWRSAFNESTKMEGYVARTIVGLSVLAIFYLVLGTIGQMEVLGEECDKDQRSYDSAVAEKSDQRTIQLDKSILDKCLVRKNSCENLQGCDTRHLQ